MEAGIQGQFRCNCYRDSMLNFLTYDFGYSWSLRYALSIT